MYPAVWALEKLFQDIFKEWSSDPTKHPCAMPWQGLRSAWPLTALPLFLWPSLLGGVCMKWNHFSKPAKSQNKLIQDSWIGLSD
jgi:hypothetical protein